MTWEHYYRVEPVPPYTDLQRGFSAELADPAWMLGRQWQIGEHAGEDASTPVLVKVPVARTPLEPVAGLDPAVVPAEALLEGSAEDWWTIGRRIRVGRAFAGTLSSAQRAAAALGTLPEPYGDAFAGEVDGRELARNGLLDMTHPELAGLSQRPDFWRSDTLTHECDVPVGGTTLQITAHDGGDVDWYTADATGPLAAPAFTTLHVVPQRLQYPGAPGPRWWQIEDGAVDIGGFPPDRAHLATALLIELICDHANDWFTFPVPTPRTEPGQDPSPTSGVVVSLGTALVKDAFDDEWELTIPPGPADPPAGPDEAPGPWSLFRTAGLDRSSLVVWPTATTPLTGPVLDDVLLGVDEDANVLWAAELRANGSDRALSGDSAAALQETQRTGTRKFTWRASTTLPEHWHPYRIEHHSSRVFVQGVVNGREPATSELLGAGKGHVLAATAVPNQGMRLERRYVLARDTEGKPVLWRQRRRLPLLAGPVSHLRFDLLQESPPLH
ncbi:hypothetical protein [Nonomuraea sp. SBT364]|uniref:hypothetical protein n=1 Tax=Nonomuraea sp. SBT364 TaxID=1580530 RepID=UPI00066B4C7B|nr:hypothetical protein [Nonomuraea sp. SBT364]